MTKQIKTSILVRLEQELLDLIDDVHHELRFKSREAAMRAMLESGGRTLLKAEESAKLNLVKYVQAKKRRSKGPQD